MNITLYCQVSGGNWEVRADRVLATSYSLKLALADARRKVRAAVGHVQFRTVNLSPVFGDDLIADRQASV